MNEYQLALNCAFLIQQARAEPSLHDLQGQTFKGRTIIACSKQAHKFSSEAFIYIPQCNIEEVIYYVCKYILYDLFITVINGPYKYGTHISGSYYIAPWKAGAVVGINGGRSATDEPCLDGMIVCGCSG